ncbi:MAG: cell division protein [Rhodospirillales bacterium]|jgi:cell division transport system permease protein|nr:cell division protein [Rhodospirillales bacterium]MDP6773156.1 cell division protein [Rhodospirillales bacterium]
MLSRRSDIPLDRDGLSRFLPWLVAFMVYLAALALAGTLVLNTLAARWDRDVSGTLTVQIPPGAGPRDDDERLRATLALFRDLPGVAYAEPLDQGRLMALLEPWLGGMEATADLPLPQLIDVSLTSDAKLDVAALSRRLAAAVPGATIDDHSIWLARLVRMVRAVEALAGAILVLIGASTVGTVVFTTRTGLAVHQEAIEVLHLTGAQDAYIARQFASRAMALGLRGGVAGLALAVPTLLGIGFLSARLEAGLLPQLTLFAEHWLALAALPLAAALIAMLTARYTVMRTLARML